MGKPNIPNSEIGYLFCRWSFFSFKMVNIWLVVYIEIKFTTKTIEVSALGSKTMLFVFSKNIPNLVPTC